MGLDCVIRFASFACSAKIVDLRPNRGRVFFHEEERLESVDVLAFVHELPDGGGVGAQ